MHWAIRPHASDTFELVNVNVGKFNTKMDLVKDLGVDLRRGIPVAIFFGADGPAIGATNAGAA